MDKWVISLNDADGLVALSRPEIATVEYNIDTGFNSDAIDTFIVSGKFQLWCSRLVNSCASWYCAGVNCV